MKDEHDTRKAKVEDTMIASAEDRTLPTVAGRMEQSLCEKPMNKPHIDHDHASGKVRGILCPSCNHGLGILETKGENWLSLALEYLKQHA